MISHDLFLLMLNLFQIRNKEKAISVFIESIEELFPRVKAKYATLEENWGELFYELSTLNYRFGAIVFESEYLQITEENKFYLDNSCALLSAILEKITYDEKIRNEAQLKEIDLQLSEKKFKAAFDSQYDGFFICDTSGKLLEVNKAFQKMTGFSKKELIGKTIPYPFWALDKQDDLTNFFFKSLNDNSGSSYESVFINKEGVKIYVQINISTIGDKDSETQLLFSSVKNISDWKKIEDELRKSEAKFRELYENMPVALFRSTEEGKISNINKAMVEMYGYNSKEEIYNKPATEFYQDPIDRKAILKELYVKGEVKDVITKEKKQDGSVIWVKSNYKAYKDSLNPERIKYIDGVAINITENIKFENELSGYRDQLEKRVKSRTKEIEEQTSKLKESQKALTFLLADVNESRKELENVIKELAEVNKELESFSYSVSHDLRAPLRAINGFTQILQEDYETLFDDEGKRILNIIINNVKSMTQLIDDLLAFTRIGRKVLNKNNIDSKELIYNIIKELTSPLLKSPKITIEENLPELYGDLNLLKQVFINLISNAIKFSSGVPQPTIEIGGQKMDEFTEIWIKDNGIGFDNKYRDKIFEVFQRLHSVDEFEGAGVGLSIVNRIIEKHEGSILVDGNPGKGAKFTVKLPHKK